MQLHFARGHHRRRLRNCRQRLVPDSRSDKLTKLPLAAGLGISSVAQVQEVAKLADIVIVGSHLITLFDQGGIPAITQFLRDCREVLVRPLV